MRALLIALLLLPLAGCTGPSDSDPNAGQIHIVEWGNYRYNSQHVCVSGREVGQDSCWTMKASPTSLHGTVDIYIRCKTDAVRVTITDLRWSETEVVDRNVAGICGSGDWNFEAGMDEIRFVRV